MHCRLARVQLPEKPGVRLMYTIETLVFVTDKIDGTDAAPVDLDILAQYETAEIS